MDKLNTPIPPLTTHNLSTNFPRWEDVEMARDQNEIGYPRYKLHPLVSRLSQILRDKYAKSNERCLCFPSYTVAKRVREYVRSRRERVKVRILQLSTSDPINDEERSWKRVCKVAVVFVDEEYYHIVKEYWQLTGEIISSRVAEYVLHEMFIIEKSTKAAAANNNSNNNSLSSSNTLDNDKMLSNAPNTIEYIESRFGRSLNFMLADKAKRLIKKRIATKVVDLENDTLNDGNPSQQQHDWHPVLNMDLMNIHAGSNLDDSDSDSDDGFDHNSNNNNNNNNNISHRGLSNLNIHQDQSNATLQSLVPAERMTEDDSDWEFLNRTNNNDSITSTNHGHNHLVNFNKDVYLYPTGMAAIHSAHRTLLFLDHQKNNRLRIPSATSLNSTTSTTQLINVNNSCNNTSQRKKTVILGTCIPDTYKLLSRFNDIHFISESGQKGLESLKNILHSGEQILTVFIEAPNLMNQFEMINLIDLKQLSELFGFYIIIDESNGGFINIDGLIYCDIMVSSLGKLFSNYDISNNEEDHDVMAGSLIINPQGKLYYEIQSFLTSDFEDLVWCEDAIHLEQNSRDVVHKNVRINKTTLKLVQDVFLPNKTHLKAIYHPSLESTGKDTYNLVKCKKNGGYGGIILLTFKSEKDAVLFYDNVKLYKGPGLGTNLTLVWPYYLGMDTLEYESKYNCQFDKTMIRICVGLEDPKSLMQIFQDTFQKMIK